MHSTFIRRVASRVALAAAVTLTTGIVVVASAAPASATPVSQQTNVANTDWTSAGVSGVGSANSGGGSGTITLAGVSGTVTHAFLAWHGNGDPAVGGPYAATNITVNGTPVAGTSKGESGSNCWGQGITSRTYVADVTTIVKATGNGAYVLNGLGPNGNSGNGANLVVTFNDGNATNNRDVYIFFGNDSQAGPNDNFPGEDSVWSDSLTNLNYQGGQAFVQLAVADGQNFGDPGDDGAVTFTGTGGPLTFPDSGLFDGSTLPDAGHSRAANGLLYDLNTFDVTGALGAPGLQNLSIDAPLLTDCLAITTAVADLPATGTSTPPPLRVSISPASVEEGTAPLPGGQKFTIMKFKVTLSVKSLTPTTVNVTTVDGTATAPVDYKSRTRTLTIPAGKRTVIFKVNVVPDAFPEADEYFYAMITGASVPIGTNTAVGTIVNDDSSATVTSAARRSNGQGGVR